MCFAFLHLQGVNTSTNKLTSLLVISGINAGDTLKDISLKVNIQESGVRKRFIKICSKIAQHNMRIMLRK